MVLEFLHSFGPLFNIREVIREGITFGRWGVGVLACISVVAVMRALVSLPWAVVAI